MYYYQEQKELTWVKQVESFALEASSFDHESHIRLACFYFFTQGFSHGLNLTSETIKTFAASAGANGKYHETLTYAYYRWLAERLGDKKEFKYWSEVKLLVSDLFENGQAVIEAHYSPFLLSTSVAKRERLLPDRKPFERELVGSTNFELLKGHRPILISIPHNGNCLPQGILNSMTEEGKQSLDTDWFLRILYDFASDFGYSLLCPQYSRYVIDLNRPATGEALYPGSNNTELCPTTNFDFEPLYKLATPSGGEINRRINAYWKPYHQALRTTLDEMANEFGNVVLFEAHSIQSQVPRFFDGELPDFNLGTNDGKSCHKAIQDYLEKFDTKDYSKVINQRFKGGYITRAYGDSNSNISSVQLELSQKAYMDEKSRLYNEHKAARVKPVLVELLKGLCERVETI